jgi:hypothetical protein
VHFAALFFSSTTESRERKLLRADETSGEMEERDRKEMRREGETGMNE